MDQKTTTVLLRLSAGLWAVWGVFHLVLGIFLMAFTRNESPVGQLASLPMAVDISMMGQTSIYPVVPSLMQHAFNLAWIGAVITGGCVFVWKQRTSAVFFCALVGGLADVGYFLFVDLAGYAEPPGPQMTYISGGAIVLSSIAYFRGARPARLGASQEGHD